MIILQALQSSGMDWPLTSRTNKFENKQSEISPNYALALKSDVWVIQNTCFVIVWACRELKIHVAESCSLAA
jgi:hypothetical protein